MASSLSPKNLRAESQDRERAYKVIRRHYDGLIKKYGFKSPHVLNYASYENQVTRFLVLSQIATLERESVLDVGCGLGDLVYLLRKQSPEISYLGIDLNDQMVTAARNKYPAEKFSVGDVFSLGPKKFDYVMASGLFGMQVGNRDSTLRLFHRTLGEMFCRANKGVAVNVLNSRYHTDAPEKYFTLSLAELYEFGSLFTDKLSVRQDYLRHDLTIYLYK